MFRFGSVPVLVSFWLGSEFGSVLGLVRFRVLFRFWSVSVTVRFSVPYWFGFGSVFYSASEGMTNVGRHLVGWRETV